MSERPPRFWLKFFRWFCNPDYAEDIEGDLLERFEKRSGLGRHARLLFVKDVLRLFRPGIIKSIEGTRRLNNYGMINNYLKMAFRSVRKDRLHTSINIFGISIGMAACILIFQYAGFEFSYDQFHAHKEQIYRVDRTLIKDEVETGRHSSSSSQLGPALDEEVPGIKSFSRTHPLEGGAVVTFDGDQKGSKRQFFEDEEKMYFVDQSFLEMFDYKLSMGKRTTLLTEPNSIVITENIWKKYLPNVDDPVGSFLKVDGGRYPGTFKITGVLATLPENTRYSFGFLLPISDLLKADQYAEGDGWGWNNFITYVMISPEVSIDQVEDQARNIINNRKKDDHVKVQQNVTFTALTDLHLRDKTSKGGLTEEKLSLFLIIALFIICIAWLNYINLSTAQAIQRAKEVGVRKVVGATNSQLVFQFLLEALLINLVALFLAFGIAFTTLPILENVSGKSFSFGVGIGLNDWIMFGSIFLLGTILSGFYPSVVLSRFKPAIVIKGSSFSGNRKFGLRQILVTLQLLIVVFLITGTWTVYRQLNFMQSEDLGLEVEQVLSIRAPFVYDDLEAVKGRIQLFREQLNTIPAVEEVSISDALPGGSYNWATQMNVEGALDQQKQSIRMMFVDDNFHQAYGIEIAAGRFHDPNLQSIEHQVVVNETLVKKFNLGTPQEALGKSMQAGSTRFPIIGVVKDYHWKSLRETKKPTLLYYTDFGTSLSVKMSTQNILGSVAEIRKIYEKLFPDNPFDYHFMDDYFNSQYQSDKQFGEIFTAFSIIAITIACLGLFGLASFTLSLRIKEIGIRKVLGARVHAILALILKDYLLLIAIAALIGLPAVYYAASYWLNDYAYRIDITVDLFIVPLIALIIITLSVVSYQSLRAATSNPSKTLKSE